MGRSDYFASGQWNFFCDFCGAKEKSSNGERTWNGYYVCRYHREERNPQDFVRGIKDNQSVPWTRPEFVDVFVPIEYDRTFLEPFKFTDSLSVKFSKNIGKLVAVDTTSKAINAGALNSPGAIPTPAQEALPYSDAIAFSTQKLFIEALSYADTITFFGGKSVTEALPISESFIAVRVSLRSVNSAPLNQYALG